jgi:hypothetical protein
MSITSDISASSIVVQGKYGRLAIGKVIEATGVATSAVTIPVPASVGAAVVTGIQGTPTTNDGGAAAATFDIAGSSIVTGSNAALNATQTLPAVTPAVVTGGGTITTVDANGGDGSGVVNVTCHGLEVSASTAGGSVRSDIAASTGASGTTLVSTVTVTAADASKTLPQGLYLSGETKGANSAITVTNITGNPFNIAANTRAVAAAATTAAPVVTFTNGTGSATFTFVSADSNSDTTGAITSDVAVSALGPIQSVSGVIASGATAPASAVALPNGALVVGIAVSTTNTTASNFTIGGLAAVAIPTTGGSSATGAVGAYAFSAANTTAAALSAAPNAGVGFTVFYAN